MVNGGGDEPTGKQEVDDRTFVRDCDLFIAGCGGLNIFSVVSRYCME